ncbi:UPF0561 protein C2orf68 homolog isoform X2 [Ranitomeya imitator]|uniref:UPF0561 protein C2orf68 homolog isoform X2 n=1 Tax=Ranitomeya imitator TaxID=111125 RepID=UPI0037E8CE52
MEEEAESRVRAGPGGRLDMNHGFVHHIRRNQKARDDYDKEVKQAKEKQRKRHTPGPSRPRKPDLQVYHPHPRERPSRTTDRADDDLTDSDSSTDPENPANQLFCLEFEADGGQVTSVVVYESLLFRERIYTVGNKTPGSMSADHLRNPIKQTSAGTTGD